MGGKANRPAEVNIPSCAVHVRGAVRSCTMENSLLCTESLSVNRGGHDPVIFADSRVLENLLAEEGRTLIEQDYFKTVQKDITPNMRSVVVSWMMEVCEELACDTLVFPLSVRLLDLFLAKIETPRCNLQLLGAVCLHVASKLRSTQLIATETMVYYTDNSIQAADMNKLELMLLMVLGWNVTPVTSADFVEHILSRVAWSSEKKVLRQHAHVLAQLCCSNADPELIKLRPSAVACGALVAAARGLNIPSKDKVLAHVCHLAKTETHEVLYVAERVEANVREHQRAAGVQPQVTQQHQKHMASSGNSNTALDIIIDDSADAEASKPATPTDIQDIYFD
ncbi:G1/S-specific cyclin-D2-like [Neocloeon triangulifer]|uniref:G1/S-specific cyclin-D2-like n=1 Tax=Neocloeon triangulifer TaxID=2078957 RepID=UPI00286ED687|nr:G1/S-specific cyclin-D2-like [Neocloeon triangulifer]